MLIRPARPEDAERLHAAVRDMAAGLGAADRVASTADSFRRHGFGPAPAFEALIAEAETRFAGACLFFPSFSSWRGVAGSYVLDLYVEAAFRGHGVGQALLADVARRTAARGGTYVRLSVDADNHAAQGFYAKLGFRWKTDERILALDGDPFRSLADSADASPLVG